MSQPIARPPRVEVSPPRFTPSLYGLLSTVEVINDDTAHWRNGVVFDASENCLTALSTFNPCLVTGSVPTKTPSGDHQWRGANAFSVYAWDDCSPIDQRGKDTARASAAAQLTNAESRTVESVLWTGLAADQPVVYPHLAEDTAVSASDGSTSVLLQSAATIVTVTGDESSSYDVVEGLGKLEDAFADCYNGVGVLHAPVELASHMAFTSLLRLDGGRYRTPKGNLVVFGAGYPGTSPDGGTPTTGFTWMYMTGALVVRRSPIFFTSTATEALDRGINLMRLIAERTYVIYWDCCHFATQVSTGGYVSGSPNQ